MYSLGDKLNQCKLLELVLELKIPSMYLLRTTPYTIWKCHVNNVVCLFIICDSDCRDLVVICKRF